MISNVTFENYRYRSYTSDPNNWWWYWNTPHAIRMLSHSDQFKPGGKGVGGLGRVQGRGGLDRERYLK
jgi:hypothetical protein